MRDEKTPDGKQNDHTLEGATSASGQRRALLELIKPRYFTQYNPVCSTPEEGLLNVVGGLDRSRGFSVERNRRLELEVSLETIIPC